MSEGNPNNPNPHDEQRIDPMKELNRLRSSVGKVIEQGITQVQSAVQNATAANSVRLDVYQSGDEVIIQTNALDGLEPTSIEVSMEGEVLLIRGETIAPDEPDDATYLLRERRFGQFERSVTIPISVKSEEAKAKLSKTGVLTVTLPIDVVRGQDIAVTPAD